MLHAPPLNDQDRHLVLVGGSGFIGSAIAPVLRHAGVEVTVVDRRPPPTRVAKLGVRWIELDILTEEITLPDGEVVLLVGNGHPRPRWLWTLPLDIAITTARLLPVLQGRKVTLMSSVEIYGTAPSPLTEETEPNLPWSLTEVAAWCDEARFAARQPCPPWRVAALCRQFADADASGRWVYGLAKLAQELLIREGGVDCTVLRLANTFGLGQERVVSRLVRRALTNRPLVVTPDVKRSFMPVEPIGRILVADLGRGTFNIGGPPVTIGELANHVSALCGSSSPQFSIPHPASDNCGVIDTTRLHAAGICLPPFLESLADFIGQLRELDEPLFEPPLPVVIPPRLARPDEVADRQQQALWSGRLKSGNRWSSELNERLRSTLELGAHDELLLTTSGTEALRLAIAGTVGRARPGQIALLPSFTYPATAEVLVQLGYILRFVDVDAHSWTLDPLAVEAALIDEPIRVVVCVDTFGNPCDYTALQNVCSQAGVPLVADSAAGLGSLHCDHPLGTQADAHAFSMSFAKVLSAAGAGGAVVFRAGAHEDYCAWLRAALMDELHAVAALEQLNILDELVERRTRIAATYARGIEHLDALTPQYVAPGNRHSYVHWVVRATERSSLSRRLALLGVETKEYFRALHLFTQEASSCQYLPVTERLNSEVLALPMSSELTEDEVDTVVTALDKAAEPHTLRMSHFQCHWSTMQTR